LEKELRLSLLALGAVTGTGESSASSWVVEDGFGNGTTGGGENKKTTAAINSECNSRTASSGGPNDGSSAIGNVLGRKACDDDDDDDDDDDEKVNGADRKDTVDLESVAGAMREVRLEG
jgi:hypothetical protein